MSLNVSLAALWNTSWLLTSPNGSLLYAFCPNGVLWVGVCCLDVLRYSNSLTIGQGRRNTCNRVVSVIYPFLVHNGEASSLPCWVALDLGISGCLHWAWVCTVHCLPTHGVASSYFLMTPMPTIQSKFFFRGSCIGGGTLYLRLTIGLTFSSISIRYW